MEPCTRRSARRYRSWTSCWSPSWSTTRPTPCSSIAEGIPQQPEAAHLFEGPSVGTYDGHPMVAVFEPAVRRLPRVLGPWSPGVGDPDTTPTALFDARSVSQDDVAAGKRSPVSTSTWQRDPPSRCSSPTGTATTTGGIPTVVEDVVGDAQCSKTDTSWWPSYVPNEGPSNRCGASGCWGMPSATDDRVSVALSTTTVRRSSSSSVPPGDGSGTWLHRSPRCRRAQGTALTQRASAVCCRVSCRCSTGRRPRAPRRGSARPSRTSLGVVVHGGTTWVRLKCVIGQSPRSLHAAANRSSARPRRPPRCRAPAARGSRGRAPARGPEHPEPADLADRRVPVGDLRQLGPDHVARRARRACSTMPSSLKISIDATALAQASGGRSR